MKSNLSSCYQGGGNCWGYDDTACDCNYHPGGCTISKVAPAGSACKCLYVGAWTCRGFVTHCKDASANNCIYPDNSEGSCKQGGGDCGGY